MLVVSRDTGLAAVGRRGGNVSLKEASTAGRESWPKEESFPPQREVHLPTGLSHEILVKFIATENTSFKKSPKFFRRFLGKGNGRFPYFREI